MMRTLEQVLAEVALSDTELRVWIEQQWVLPSQSDGGYLFDDADLARVQLICDLRRDLMVNDEAIPVVLSLLDQIHELRHTLAELNAAIKGASEAAQEEIAGRLSSDS